MITGYGSNSKSAAKKKRARPFGWRNVLNWTFAPSIALALWYMTIIFLVDAINLWEAMESIWYWLPVIFVAVTLGLALGAVQSFVLPLQLAGFRRQWFWWTAAMISIGFSVALMLNQSVFDYDLLDMDNGADYLRGIPLLFGLALPLLFAQSRLLRTMQHAYRGTDVGGDGPLQRFVWLWWLPNLLLIAMMSVPDGDNGQWMTICLLVWGFGMGLVLWWVLREPQSPAKNTPQNHAT